MNEELRWHLGHLQTILISLERRACIMIWDYIEILTKHSFFNLLYNINDGLILK